MCLICVKDVAAAVVRIYFELCCLIVGETFFQPTQLSGFVLNGKVKVMLITICSLKSVQSREERRHSGKDVSRRHHQSRAELGPMPTWVVRMVAGVVPREWPGTGRGLAPVRCSRGC